MNSFNLNTYVIGGPENIQERHLLPSETKSKALVRFVDIFSSLGLDVFQLRFKNSSDCDFLKLANEVAEVLKNKNCKLCINDNVQVAKKLNDDVDILHIGHLNIIKEASKYGDVTVGVLTDKAIASYKRLPFLSYEIRSKTVESIKGVQAVISQDTLDYTQNLLKVKKFFDAEYKVESIDFEDHRVIREGKEVVIPMMAQAYINHKGHEVAVGSGWNQEQRIKYHANPKLIIGKTITVQYFEETKNQEGGLSLRFPTVKHVYEQRRDV